MLSAYGLKYYYVITMILRDKIVKCKESYTKVGYPSTECEFYLQ